MKKLLKMQDKMVTGSEEQKIAREKEDILKKKQEELQEQIEK